MGNCKSVSANGGVDVQRPEGYDAIKTPKATGENAAASSDTAPLIKQINIDTNSKSKKIGITDIAIPTSPTSETCHSGDSGDSNKGPACVDDWIDTKPTIEVDDDTEEQKKEYLQFDPNSSAPLEQDAPDDEKAAEEGKEDEKQEEKETAIVPIGPMVADAGKPAYQLTLPIVGAVPTSIFKMATDYVTSEFNALTVGSQTEQQSAWALNPKDIGKATAAKKPNSAAPSVVIVTDKQKKNQWAADEKVEDSSPAAVIVSNNQKNSQWVEDGFEVEESNPAAVIVSYKQKESQWAIEEVVKPNKRRGPRPEDVGRTSASQPSSAKKVTMTSTNGGAPMPTTPTRKSRMKTTPEQRRCSSEKKKRTRADPLNFMTNW